MDLFRVLDKMKGFNWFCDIFLFICFVSGVLFEVSKFRDRGFPDYSL